MLGNVISLNPEEGSVVEEGSDVTVAVSIGEGTAYAGRAECNMGCQKKQLYLRLKSCESDSKRTV